MQQMIRKIQSSENAKASFVTEIQRRQAEVPKDHQQQNGGYIAMIQIEHKPELFLFSNCSRLPIIMHHTE